MSQRVIQNCWPLPDFVEEELEARGVQLEPFLNLTGISMSRWTLMKSGEKGALLSECEKIAGALNVSTQFIANLNHSYMTYMQQRRKEVTS